MVGMFWFGAGCISAGVPLNVGIPVPCVLESVRVFAQML